MTDTIILDVNLRAFARQETSRRWVAVCPSIGVASQGDSENDAKSCLKEAVELWFESCIERGVLDQAMRESNFHPAATGEHRGEAADAGEPDILGDPFLVSVTIPAYQASAFLASA